MEDQERAGPAEVTPVQDSFVSQPNVPQERQNIPDENLKFYATDARVESNEHMISTNQ